MQEIIPNNTNFLQKHEKNAKNDKFEDGKFYCDCGKSYKHKPNLYSHRKKCKNENTEDNQDTNLAIINKEETTDYKDLVFKLIDENKNLQNIIIEQNKQICNIIPNIANGQNNNSNNTINQKTISDNHYNNNSNNSIKQKTISDNNHNNNSNNNIKQNFNISLFLNENCKDALSIAEFVKQIEISIKDLMFTKENGVTNGVSNIFIENLNKLPLDHRPVWCGDKKTKQMYVKGEEWQEDKDNEKTKQAIKDVSILQTKNTNTFIKDKPNWMKDEKIKEEYISIVKNATEPISENSTSNIMNKIINNVYLDDKSKDELTK
jgi:hypothetical protein